MNSHPLRPTRRSLLFTGVLYHKAVSNPNEQSINIADILGIIPREPKREVQSYGLPLIKTIAKLIKCINISKVPRLDIEKGSSNAVRRMPPLLNN